MTSKEKDKAPAKPLTKCKSESDKDIDIEEITPAKCTKSSTIALKPVRSTFSFHLAVLLAHPYQLPLNTLAAPLLLVRNIEDCQEQLALPLCILFEEFWDMY